MGRIRIVPDRRERGLGIHWIPDYTDGSPLERRFIRRLVRIQAAHPNYESMGSFNKVILMGNLTRDPELRYTGSNLAVCKIGLAINRRVKDQQSEQWREEPTYVDVTIFGKRGESYERYHKKGTPTFIEGELRYDTWEDKETGAKRSKLYVVANNWEFVSSGRGEGGGAGGSGGGDYGGGYGSDSRGQDSFQNASAGAGSSSGGYGDGGYGGGDGAGGSGAGDPSAAFLGDDDTPF